MFRASFSVLSLLMLPLFLLNCEGDPNVSQLAQDVRSEYEHTLRTPGFTEGWIRLTIEPERAFENDEEKAREIAQFAYNNWQGETAEGVVIIMETASGSSVTDAAQREEFEFAAEDLE